MGGTELAVPWASLSMLGWKSRRISWTLLDFLSLLFCCFFFPFLPEQPASSADTCSPLWHLPLLLFSWEMCPLFSLLPWSMAHP